MLTHAVVDLHVMSFSLGQYSSDAEVLQAVTKEAKLL
jgi:hypothetical protein